MIKLRKSLTVSFAAALMLTTSATAFAVPSDNNFPIPGVNTGIDQVVENLIPGSDIIEDEDVDVAEIDEDAEDFDDEVSDEEDDDDEIAGIDDEGDDEDGEEEVADEDDDDADDNEEDFADSEDEDLEDDVAEADEDGDDVEGDEEIEGIAEGDDDEADEDDIYDVTAKYECDTYNCGGLELRDEDGNVVYSSDVYFDPDFAEYATPSELTFANTHVGCKIRGYFEPIEGADGLVQYSFYVEEFL